MTGRKAKFIDRTGWTPEPLELTDPLLIPKEDMDAEIERLAAVPPPNNGRRHTVIAHPDADRFGPGDGLNCGVRVTIEVLLPGEQSLPIRHNSTQVNFCIQGAGHSIVGNRKIRFEQFDVWNFPSMQTYRHVNDSDDLHVRLSYSNAPLLEKMNVHIVEDNPPVEFTEVGAEEAAATEADDARRKSPYGTFQLTEDGAWLMPYETLVAPEAVESRALHWPWKMVKAELDKLQALGKDYVGRRLYLLFNPMTGRTNGTTPNFFATMTVRPAPIVDRPHRHVSSAMNYYFGGKGRSTVEGKVYEWKAGDFMLTAPGWAVHNHAATEGVVYELTIQDQPINIIMESLLWQEDMKKPWHILGAEYGFDTNREKVAG